MNDPEGGSSTTGIDHDAAVLWEALFQLVLTGEDRLVALLKDHGLTTQQFYVLKTLHDHDGAVAIGRIADAHGLTNASMTGLIQRMEAQTPPLVMRNRATGDRRSVIVRLTDDGRARYAAVQQALLGQLRALLALIPDAERTLLIAQIPRYVAILSAALG